MPPPMPLLRSGSLYSFGSQSSAASNLRERGPQRLDARRRVVDLFGEAARFEDQRSDLRHIDEEAEVIPITIVTLPEIAHAIG